MSWQESFTAPGSWSDPFGATAGRSNPHRGTDLARLTLYAWETLTVVNSDLFFSSLGYCMVVRCSHGYLFGIAHARGGTRAQNGKVLQPGDLLCHAANGPVSLSHSNPDFPGYQWAGRHFHITMTSGADVFGSSGLLDGRPHIVQQAGGGGGGDADYAWGLTTAAQRDLQRALTKLKRYSGLIDGAFGLNSVKAMQEELRDGQGLLPKSYDADGIPGINYGTALQKLAQAYGYSGPLDGLPGADTSAKLSIWAANVNGEATPPVVTPPKPETPKAWEKTYPGASVVVPSPNREPRKADSKIGYVILHGTANPVDHTAYFSRSNERQVAPNEYLRPSGEVKEFVRLGERAWTTAVPLDHQAVTFEIESDNTTYTDAQYEALAQFCAWLSQQTVVDDVPVEFKLDRAHVLGHNEVPGVTSGTSCPGKLDIDRVVKRAQEIVKPTQLDQIVVTRKQLDAWRKALEDMSVTGGNVLSEIGKVLEK